MHDQFLRRLISTIKCSVCGQRYKADNVNVLGHQEDLWFLGVYCLSCRSHGLVAAVVKEGKLPEIVTDLTETEKTESRSNESVHINDVLDMHNFLKSFDGDFLLLFTKEQQDSQQGELL